MFERRIYSHPKSPGIELHGRNFLGHEEHQVDIYENGALIFEQFELPKENADVFIEGFFQGCAYALGELRTIRLKDSLPTKK